MELEIYEIVKAINRLIDKVIELSSKIDFLSKGTSQQFNAEDYCEEPRALRLLHISPSTLYRLRKAGEIPYIKNKRKILYPVEGIRTYLQRHTKA